MEPRKATAVYFMLSSVLNIATVILVVVRGCFNVALSLTLASIFAPKEAAVTLFAFTLASQVRGISEFNLSNFCVLRIQDGVKVRNFSIGLLIWQLLIIQVVFLICASLGLLQLNSLVNSIVLFVVCNQGIWALVYAYGSADNKFHRHLVVHAGLLGALVFGLSIFPDNASNWFFGFCIIAFIYFLVVVLGFDAAESGSKFKFRSVTLYVRPFALNSFSALLFVTVSMPLVLDILPSEDYIIYSIVIQISGAFQFMYRALSKNILARLYVNQRKGSKEDTQIITLLIGSLLLFLLAQYDIGSLSNVTISLGETKFSITAVTFASALGLVSLTNLHQNNCMQAINENWSLLGFRVLSNSMLLVSYGVVYFVAQQVNYPTVVAIDFSVVLAIVLATRIFLNKKMEVE